MKKFILLILSLFIATLSYSQNTYPKILSDSTVEITNTQLKQANKLFAEGEKYKNLYLESCTQVDQYKNLESNYIKIDSLRVADINSLTNALQVSEKNNKKLSTKNKLLGCSSIGLTIITILVLLFK